LIGRILGTALLAGAIAGLFAFAAHVAKTLPLIERAEVYEAQKAQAPAHGTPTDAAATAAAGEAAWSPADGVERLAYTLLADVVGAVGFAFLLVGAIVISGRRVAWREGMAWGLAGFAAFSAAPALGLAPEVPGMEAAPLHLRQAWWLATAAATALGLAVVCFAKPPLAKAAGVLLIALPHVVGAPVHVAEPGPVPAELAAQFATASLVISGLFWVLLGGLAGYIYPRLGRD
jgi:cobalt transporter subunit CbtA